MAYLVTLVHGTFANNAPWTNSESEFRRNISDALGDVTFEIYDWSGENSHQHRVNASKDLAEMLKKQLQIPEKQKVIIAHSHGGNISMYALKSLGDDNANFKLITLATPFLNVSKREYENYLTLNIYLLPAVLISLAAASICLLLFVLLKKNFTNLYFVPFILGFIAYPALLRQTKNVQKKINEKVNAAILSTTLGEEQCRYDILSIIDHNDEIQVWFSGLYRVWELIMLIQRAIFQGILSFIAVIITWGFFEFIFDLTLGTNFLKLIDSSIENKISFITLMILAFMLTGVLAFFVIIFLTACIFYVLKSNPLMLGWESWIYQLFIKIVPSTTPFGFDNVKFIQHNSRKKSLKHSIYEHDQIIENIKHWLTFKNGSHL